MTISPPAALLGSQEPRVLTRPPFATEAAGLEAIELAESVGLYLDPWQELVVRVAMAEGGDGLWAASEVGLLVARQNGKGAAFEAIFLHGLFLDERMRLQLWTAHQFKTSTEAFIRIKGWVDGSDDLRRRVRRINAAHGEEGIELLDGSRLRFLARSKSSGRGFSPQRAGLDEAQELSDAAYSAMVPAMSAQPAKHILYAGTVPDPEVNHPDVFTRVRDRGRAGGARRLAWLEWTPPGSDDPELAEAIDLEDPANQAAANPGLGFRLTESTIEDELDSMDEDAARRERYSIWPSGPAGAWIVPRATWRAQCRWDERRGRATARLTGLPMFAIDVSLNRAKAYIAAAGASTAEPGAAQFELVRAGAGTGWVVREARKLAKRHGCETFIVDAASEAASLTADLEEVGLRVIATDAAEMAAACGQWYDAVTDDGSAFHLGEPLVDDALAGAVWRELEGRRALGRRKSTVDIAPLVACVLALWGHHEHGDYDVLDSVY